MSWHLTRSATHIRRRLRVDAQGQPLRDKYQNDLYDETSAPLSGCTWEPRATLASDAENVEARQQVTSGLNFYCDDPAVDIRAIDALIVDGLRYEVDGEVARYTGSRMGNDYATVALRRETG